MKKYTDAERKEHRDQRLSAAHDRFQAGVAELLADGGAWQRYLTMQAKMHTYSFHNTMLILTQNPEASMVAGFRKWQEMGRNVRKGEKSIWILAPFTGKRDDEEGLSEDGVIRYTYFKPVSVFDVSQTEGDPLPEPQHPVQLEGNSPELVDRYVAVQTILEADGWTVKRELPETLGALGTTDPATRLVRIHPDVSDAQALKTLVHEAAHIQLEHIASITEYRLHRGRMEAEAESTAFLVLSGIGIDTSDFSLPYVAGWSKGDAKIVAEVADRVSKCARAMLDQLDWSADGS